MVGVTGSNPTETNMDDVTGSNQLSETSAKTPMVGVTGSNPTGSTPFPNQTSAQSPMEDDGQRGQVGQTANGKKKKSLKKKKQRKKKKKYSNKKHKRSTIRLKDISIKKKKRNTTSI